MIVCRSPGPSVPLEGLTVICGPGERQTIMLFGFSLAGSDRQGSLQFATEGADGASNTTAVVSYALQSCIRSGDGDTHAIQAVAANSDGNTGRHGKKHGGG